jgi:hypothetical protein
MTLSAKRALGVCVFLSIVAIGLFLVIGTKSAKMVSTKKHPHLAPTTTTTTFPTTTTTVTAGTLPQTDVLPSSTTVEFLSEMSSLWHAIASNTVAGATFAFFPKSAYLQLKEIGNPSTDYEYRLIHDYDLDIKAAATLLGSDASTATFIGVNVPTQYAHWVNPGVCENGIGYYEVANSRLIYQVRGQIKSFGIASLISWRGMWYVVHLGGILRSSDSGLVLDPATGTGYSVASRTC